MNETENIARPRTAKELAALPIGPEIGFTEHKLTATDRERGYIVVDGMCINIAVRCNSIRIPVMSSVVSYWSESDDPVSFTFEGENWTIGRYADGRWFRSRS